ncbi:MAG: hypothetical protein ACRBB6_13340 [Neptuniibacter sp.]
MTKISNSMMTTGWTTKGWFSPTDGGMHPALPLPENITEKYTEEEILEADERIFEGEAYEVARRRYWRLFHVDLPRGIMFEESGDLVHLCGHAMYTAWQTYHCKHPILPSWIHENPGATFEAFWRMYPMLFTPGKGVFHGVDMKRENNAPHWMHPAESYKLLPSDSQYDTMVTAGSLWDTTSNYTEEDNGVIVDGSDWERNNELFGNSDSDSDDDLARELSTSMSMDENQ